MNNYIKNNFLCICLVVITILASLLILTLNIRNKKENYSVFCYDISRIDKCDQFDSTPTPQSTGKMWSCFPSQNACQNAINDVWRN